MKKIINILIILCVSFTSYSQQSFQGEATYIGQIKPRNVKMDSSKLSSNLAKNSLMLALNKRINSGVQETYTLKFNEINSLYKKEEKLEAPNPTGVRFSVDIGFSGDKLYKNIKENRYTIESDLYGKVFLIKDKLEKHNWKLENETKKIGNYTCYKATKIIKKQVVDNKFISLTVSENKSETPVKQKTKEVKITITAWYTPQIPVSLGPGIYHGLPGLILEVINDTQIILCNKIILNPKRAIKIKEPKKGEKVNQVEFDEILKIKRKENKERGRS